MRIMFKYITRPNTKSETYDTLTQTLDALLEGTNDDIAILSNSVSLIKYFLKDVSWVGFYLFKKNQLILGPFQGFPACTNIEIGSGVCGSSFEEDKTMLVRDVNAHPNHIACDSNTQSEIVIPIHKNNTLFGVLDLDSFKLGRFTKTDQTYLENIVKIIEKHLNRL